MVLRLHRESADKGPSLTEPAATELPIAPVAPKLNTKYTVSTESTGSAESTGKSEASGVPGAPTRLSPLPIVFYV